MNDNNRWPIIIVSVLAITILVNIGFVWSALNDPSGGFENVSQEIGDSSYKIKRSLED